MSGARKLRLFAIRVLRSVSYRNENLQEHTYTVAAASDTAARATMDYRVKQILSVTELDFATRKPLVAL